MGIIEAHLAPSAYALKLCIYFGVPLIMRNICYFTSYIFVYQTGKELVCCLALV